MPALLAALVLVLAAPGAAGAAAPRTILQDDAQLLGPEAARERALDDMVRAGADVVRLLARWRRLDEDPTGLDAAVAGAQRRGLEVLLVPTGPAPDRFAACRRPDLPPGACRPSPAAFGAFVETLGRRFPAIRSWALWNEPNNGAWLGPQAQHGRPVAPRLYRELVREGAAALARSGHVRDEVLVGETAAVGGGERERPGLGPTAPGRFLRALLCPRCAPLPGTGFGHHPYARGGSRGPFTPAAPGAYGPAELGALRALLRRAWRQGRTRRRLALHVTEAGFQTLPPDRLLGVPLHRHAAFLDAMERVAWPHARSVAQYPLVDERAQGGFQSGLRFADGRAKPALRTFATPAWVACGVLRGRLRPARRAGVPVALERRVAGGWQRVRVSRTRAGGVVAVRLPVARGPWRLRWRDAAGASHRSRAVDPRTDPRPRRSACPS